MSFSDSGLLDIMAKKMGYLSQRQSLLAQNVSNANTPAYKAKDLKPFSFEDALKESNEGMKVTSPMHITPASFSAGPGGVATTMKSYETLPNGNAVDMEQQAMQISKTAIDYQGVLALYKKMTTWVKMALGKGS